MEETTNLSFDNILGEQEINDLFSFTNDNVKEESSKEDTESKKAEETVGNKEQTTEVTDPEELFGEVKEEEKQPESVGSEKNTKVKEKEDTNPAPDSGTSPNQNFYSSIANALAVDGIFPNLSDEDVGKVDDAESFSDLIEAEVNARLSEQQQRVVKALNNGVEQNTVKQYEGILNYINSITDSQLSEEGEKGEQVRHRLIYQDFLNKGYTPEKAEKLTMRTIDAGTDIEDAKEALQSNKEYFGNAYNNILEEAQAKQDAVVAERKKEAAQLKDSLLKDKTLMGDMDLDNSVRRKTLETITKPVYRDPDTGQYYTALQKYEMEHSADFLKYAGLFYTLTDGFKDFDSFTKGKVKKEVRKGLRELETALNSTRRDQGGNLNMVTNVKDDPNSYLGRDWTISL